MPRAIVPPTPPPVFPALETFPEFAFEKCCYVTPRLVNLSRSRLLVLIYPCTTSPYPSLADGTEDKTNVSGTNADATGSAGPIIQLLVAAAHQFVAS